MAVLGSSDSKGRERVADDFAEPALRRLQPVRKIVGVAQQPEDPGDCCVMRECLHG